MSKISTRTAYGEALAAIGGDERIIVLDADLQCCTRTEKFAALYPERSRNVGIAEANMVGMAAGLAACGKIVFVNSFAMFAAGRAWEQVRNSVAYPHLNVKVVGSHGGLSVGEDGATHQCNEDIALMRTIPGMTIVNPADGIEAAAAVEAAINTKGPFYLRFGRYAVPYLYDENYKFELGKGVKLKDGKDVTIIATGLMVHLALEAANTLAAEGIDAEVINIHTIKPLDKDMVVASAKKTGAVVTAEEHSVIGGLGGAVCETLSENAPVPVLRVGVEDRFGMSGKVPELLNEYGLTAENIAEKARAAVKLKIAK